MAHDSQDVVARTDPTTRRRYKRRSGIAALLLRAPNAALFAFMLGPVFLWGVTWRPQTMFQLAVVMFTGMVLLVWYIIAQENAILHATEDENLGNDRISVQDYGWSIWPVVVIVIALILHVVALVLTYQTTTFQVAGREWIRERMDLTYGELTYLGISAWAVFNDLTKNPTLLTRILRLTPEYRAMAHR